MASITSSVGLTTGIDIQGVVDKLIAISAVPRDNLQTRTDKLKDEQLGITELSAYLYAFQSLVVNLGKESLYENKTATTSNDAALTATVTSNSLATIGNYTFTSLQAAQNEQWLSSGVTSKDVALGGGEFSFRFGDNLERATPLEILNEGDGIDRGVIRITDRSGAWADIDLTAAQTLEDVVDAISSNLDINVTAELHGDGIRLTDDTGQTTANLLVQEVSGTTAASLGLDGINVAASSAQGTDIVSLYDDLELSQLNDGNGVRFVWEEFAGDIKYTLADGTTDTIDFTPSDGESGFKAAPLTIGQLIDRFNEEADGKMEMAISADGKQLEVTDLTSGEGAFTLMATDAPMSHTLADLGLTTAADTGVITGRRVLGGTGSVLVSTLNGGSNAALTSIDITDRTGSSANVDLSGAETIEQVLEAINASGLQVTASLNQAKNGILLTDTSGSEISNFIVSSTDETADNLGLTADTDQTTIRSGDLHQQIISYDTKLDDLNGGAGIKRGNFTIIDSAGKHTVINLADPKIQTVGDLMRAATEGESNNIRIDINPDGDGLLIIDESTGGQALKVIDGTKGAAASLQFTGEREQMEVDGVTRWVINGSMTHTITLEEGDTIKELVEKVNDANGGATASILNDGSSRPYHMVLGSSASGLQSAMVLDWSQMGMSFSNTSEGKDAAISLGAPDSGIIMTSSTNDFSEVVDGLTLHVQAASSTPTTITVGRSNTDFVATVEVMVSNYNKFRDRYADMTSFNEETGESGVLFSDSTTRRLGSELGWALADRYVGLGEFQSIRELGITISSNDGTLSLDKDVLKAAFAADPEAVKEFFTSDPTPDDAGIHGRITVDDVDEPPIVGSKGFAVVLKDLLDSLIGPDTSMVAKRYMTLENKITSNEERIDFLDDRLEAERERLLWKFYYMELSIAKIQNNLTAIESIQPLNISYDYGSGE